MFEVLLVVFCGERERERKKLTCILTLFTNLAKMNAAVSSFGQIFILVTEKKIQKDEIEIKCN